MANEIKKIMVVDDEEIIREIIKDQFELLGVESDVFSNGTEAVEFLKASPDMFDAVILDRTLPDMTGQELLEKILNINNSIKVGFASGDNINSEIEVDGKNVILLLQKPVRLNDLEAFLKLI
jgi:CheY-like chemotaxis protein